MKANFHTHTFRCNHATGTEREYVESAIKVGLKTLGFSDHCPYFFDGIYVPYSKMRPEQTEEYVKTVRDLKEEYKKDIDIYCGLEVEYYPKYFETLIKFLGQFGFDYYILGQHYTNNECDGKHVFSGNNSEENLDNYVNEVLDGIDTGLFSYIAHPDMIVFSGNDDLYVKQMSRICQKAKEYNLPVEFNFNGFYGNRTYPCKKFFNLAKEFGNDIIMGIDAHCAELIDNCQEIEKKAISFLGDGVKIVDKIKLLNGKTV